MKATVRIVVVVGIAAVLPESIMAQAKRDETVTLVTVCEILKNPRQFNGKNLAVLGRFSASEEGRWLTEDDCGYKLVTGSYSWPNTVWLQSSHEPALDPPSGSLVLDKDVLGKKLAQVRKTTQLRFQRRWVEVTDEKSLDVSDWHEIKDEWAVAYGRLEARSELNPPNRTGPNRYWGNGFGHLAAAPVQLVFRDNNMKLIPDDQQE